MPESWMLALATALAAVLAWLGCALIIRHGTRLGLADIPNDRSSHVVPRPTGGGAAIVVALLLAGALVLPDGGPVRATAWLWPAGALLLATTGLVDDLKNLGQGVRLLLQASALVAAMLAIVAPVLPVLPLAASLAAPLAAPSAAAVPPSMLLPLLGVGCLALLAGLWWVNLFNFMDGIDGLAASQALFMVLAGLLLRTLPGPDPVPAMLPADADGLALIDAARRSAAFVLAGALAGFLVMNWHPARLFMGDCGSLFLGFMVFTFALHDVTYGFTSLWPAVILSAVFVVDASLTLIRRRLRGENVRQAHRSHAYQRLSRRAGNHATVALVYWFINVAWLLPLAITAQRLPSIGALLCLIAVLPLAGAAWWAGAGTSDPQTP